MTDLLERRVQAKLVRIKAAETAFNRKPVPQESNGDEGRFENKIGSFTKGLPHCVRNGVLFNPSDFDLFVRSINSGQVEDQIRVPLGPPNDGDFISGIAENAMTRAWESSGAGLIFQLEGPDTHAVTIPPAPKLDSDELVTEMTEVYSMALVRDVPFVEFDNSDSEGGMLVGKAVRWVNDAIKRSHSYRGPFNRCDIFRGPFAGENIGPLVSQFLLVGNAGIDNQRPRRLEDGRIQYGSITIDQRLPVATPGKDYMTTWGAYIDVQNGANLAGLETYLDQSRFIAAPRDLATYVHYDALYQAYLNACLILLAMRLPFDKGIPFQKKDSKDKQQGFASWGGPHLLTILTEVSTRALHAVRYQKFNVHRRLRPEAVGGLVDRYLNAKDPTVSGIAPLADRLNPELLKHIADHNREQNKHPDRQDDPDNGHTESYLLPMAFPEGSPMHPSYGAGHATVAGACVTILKAWFDCSQTLPFAFEASKDGSTLQKVPEFEGKLTVGHELNKIAGNISIGRNWAGVHYFSDYIESAKLGEEIAIGILEEQACTYPEDFSMTIPTFTDGNVIIKKKGSIVSIVRKGVAKHHPCMH